MAVAQQSASPQRGSLAAFVRYFLRLGTFGFGGPIALAGYMQRDLVESKSWITQEEYLEGLAFAQLAPGPLAAQLAIYLGYIRAGFLGATLVGIAFILPSFLMVLGLSAAYVRFGGLPWMQAVFYGIGGAVIAIIARSAVKLVRAAVKTDVALWTIFLVLAISTAWTEREIAWLFLGGGLLNLVVKGFRIPVSGRLSAMALAPIISFIDLGKFWEILYFFGKAGLFVFGSGLAIVPFLHGGVVQEHHWLTERQFIDAVAVAMITPGPVVITVAFIGYLVAGLTGAVAASLGVFLPVYLITVILAPQYKRFAKNPQVHAFVDGVTAAATGAIAGAVIVLAKRSIIDRWTVGIALATFAVLAKWKIPEPLLILASATVGLLVHRH